MKQKPARIRKAAKVRPDAQLAALTALLEPKRTKDKPDPEEILRRHDLKV